SGPCQASRMCSASPTPEPWRDQPERTTASAPSESVSAWRRRSTQSGWRSLDARAEYPKTATSRFGSASATPPQRLERDERARDGQHDHDRLLAAELRLAARALAHVHGNLVHAQTRLVEPEQRLHLGRGAVVRLGEDRDRLRVRRVEPAGRVVE